MESNLPKRQALEGKPGQVTSMQEQQTKQGEIQAEAPAGVDIEKLKIKKDKKPRISQMIDHEVFEEGDLFDYRKISARVTNFSSDREKRLVLDLREFPEVEARLPMLLEGDNQQGKLFRWVQEERRLLCAISFFKLLALWILQGFPSDFTWQSDLKAYDDKEFVVVKMRGLVLPEPIPMRAIREQFIEDSMWNVDAGRCGCKPRYCERSRLQKMPIRRLPSGSVDPVTLAKLSLGNSSNYPAQNGSQNVTAYDPSWSKSQERLLATSLGAGADRSDSVCGMGLSLDQSSTSSVWGLHQNSAMTRNDCEKGFSVHHHIVVPEKHVSTPSGTIVVRDGSDQTFSNARSFGGLRPVTGKSPDARNGSEPQQEGFKPEIERASSRDEMKGRDEPAAIIASKVETSIEGKNEKAGGGSVRQLGSKRSCIEGTLSDGKKRARSSLDMNNDFLVAYGRDMQTDPSGARVTVTVCEGENWCNVESSEVENADALCCLEEIRGNKELQLRPVSAPQAAVIDNPETSEPSDLTDDPHLLERTTHSDTAFNDRTKAVVVGDDAPPQRQQIAELLASNYPHSPQAVGTSSAAITHRQLLLQQQAPSSPYLTLSGPHSAGPASDDGRPLFNFDPGAFLSKVRSDVFLQRVRRQVAHYGEESEQPALKRSNSRAAKVAASREAAAFTMVKVKQFLSTVMPRSSPCEERRVDMVAKKVRDLQSARDLVQKNFQLSALTLSREREFSKMVENQLISLAAIMDDDRMYLGMFAAEALTTVCKENGYFRERLRSHRLIRRILRELKGRWSARDPVNVQAGDLLMAYHIPPAP